MESAKKISTISDIVELISANLTGSQQKVIYLKNSVQLTHPFIIVFYHFI